MNDSRENSPELFNVRAPCFLLARTQGACGRCGAPLRLFALVVPPGHETLEEDDSPAGETWQVARHHAFLFHVGLLPAAIRALLEQHALSYRAGASAAEHGDSWANHCARCGAAQDDQDLFCEPGGAFFPVDEAGARGIELQGFDAAFAAAAGGYAHELEFYDAMRRS
jgi:hypothetical protein